jgi:hypothetical protein
LSAISFPYFIGGMMREIAIPVRQEIMIIEIRPCRNDWQCFAAPGVKQATLAVTSGAVLVSSDLKRFFHQKRERKLKCQNT